MTAPVGEDHELRLDPGTHPGLVAHPELSQVVGVDLAPRCLRLGSYAGSYWTSHHDKRYVNQ